jgi:hypothetical protein
MGLFMFFMWGLRVSRLLDRRAVSGSTSDTPTRARILGYLSQMGNLKQGILGHWEEGYWILDPGYWMLKEWERRRRQETASFAPGYGEPRKTAGSA